MNRLIEMKSFLTIVLMVTSCSWVLANDTELPTLRFAPAGHQQKFALEVTDLRSDAEARIEDAQGFTLMRESMVGNETHRKLFNLEDLPRGAYQFVLRVGYREMVQPFQITEHGIKMREQQQFNRFLPVVQVRPNQTLAFSLLNRRISGAKISLRDSDNQTWYEEELAPKLSLQRMLDVSRLPKGRYTFVVRTDEDVYYEQVTL